MTFPSVADSTSYLMWFRRDLRVEDNTALSQLTDSAKQALTQNNPSQLDVSQSSVSKAAQPTISNSAQPKIHALFVVTAEQWLEHDMSIVQMDFIFRTLKVLATSLFDQLDIELHVLKTADFDSCIETVVNFCEQHSITYMASNYEYEVNEMQRDAAIEQRLKQQDIEFSRYHDQCILPPKAVTTNDETMYKIFTPFYKKWQSILETSPPNLYSTEKVNSDKPAAERLSQILATIDDLHQQTLRLFSAAYFEAESANQDDQAQLLKNAEETFVAGEVAAYQQLQTFLAEDVQRYDIARDQPALEATSRLSPYLTVGAISPRVCYLKAKQAAEAIYEANVFNQSEKQTNKPLENSNEAGAQQDIQRWISELAWRDFYRHVIADRPDIVKGTAFNKVADTKVHWSYDEQDFSRWCQGQTGVPLIDAAMRCLNQTGFMHNRLRMVTAMFLTKDLFIDWRWGERYFMQRLIDGDFASNNGGWQWSASVGTDAAPYFRIMNPFSQAKTHDKEAIFIKTWLPELKAIKPSILHDEAKLRQALSTKGELANVDYPQPMVEHKQARLYAIGQFKG
ncbi:cryptochrome/photolyase family protein [Psychrobacter sanguinis]|uniref:cryptochrome/photolyase family protein n=1 Tax=Psychrobacter sanguinis TaxID=861445 RepID=UPI001918BA42|nr:FAD-binding domain-containing protein [Psychrobacter sanguinis]MCC3344014.1 deoxyribodipyrimidine photo-lyase [Psychrobacter sanguinis]